MPPQYVKHSLIKPGAMESRLYQEVLSARALEKGNSLVVAPTALGKTAVAALVAARLLEKKPEEKVLILAPTKPLTVQHRKSFERFLSVPSWEIALLTGELKPSEREKIFLESRVVCATPQAIENDLENKRLSLGKVSLLVFDEAHRAVGDYSYVRIAKKFREENPSGLVLALTASPGGTRAKINEIRKNLFIENVEIREEGDLDVRPYTHEIEMRWETVQLPAKFVQAKRLFEYFIKQQMDFLHKLGYARNISPKFMRKKDLLELQKKISMDVAVKAKHNPAIYAAASRTAALLKASHAQMLLETQGISPLKKYLEKIMARGKEPGSPKAIAYLLKQPEIRKAVSLVEEMHETGTAHPKAERLAEILEKQFSGNPGSRVLVFSNYRDSGKFLENFLKTVSAVKAKRFVGQAPRAKEKGMSQKEQIKAIEEFREGKFNTLIATSVGEEGLDIPEVDLVVFFEPVPSEIRSIQRRGRTGRMGKGKAVILMAKGTRDEAFYWSAVSKERKMKSMVKRMKGKDSVQQVSQTTLLKFDREADDKIVIFADTREQGSKVLGRFDGIPNLLVHLKQLDIGDFILGKDVGVERKTVSDFLQSMVDGRLFSQLLDLSTRFERPLLLLEGNPEELFELRNIHENAIRGALSSIALDYRVPVLFTKNCEETAKMLYTIAKREQLGKEKDIRLRLGRKGLSEAEMQQFIVESLPLVGPKLARNLV